MSKPIVQHTPIDCQTILRITGGTHIKYVKSDEHIHEYNCKMPNTEYDNEFKLRIADYNTKPNNKYYIYYCPEHTKEFFDYEYTLYVSKKYDHGKKI